MSLPKSNIWQEIRLNCLSAVPQGSRCGLTHPYTLEQWITHGSYTVGIASDKEFIVQGSTADIGNALIGDIELFLDHATEHQVTIWKMINSRHWVSPAWLAVTYYYWAYFLLMALTRLTGSTVFFLKKEAITQLTTIASIKTCTLGQGSFRFVCKNAISSTQREISLLKDGSRVHDDIWKSWFNTIRACSH